MRIEDIFGEADVTVRCPACSHAFQKRLKELLRDGVLVKCPYCLVDIAIKIDRETGNQMDRANKALADLERSIKKLGRTMRVR